MPHDTPQAQLVQDLDRLESALRARLQGKVLLGEVPFEQRHCDQCAVMVKTIISDVGLTVGLRLFRERWRATYGLWLTSEAFFSYSSGAYWPPVLSKVGIENFGCSSWFGVSFLDTLERFKLPRFRRLNTHWSYLGPILAHCGVPRSCLPEYFSEVIPLASRIGISAAEGMAELQDELPELHLSRAVEWFLRFGDRVAEDFLRRSLDLWHVARGGGELPPAAALGLPPRVVEAFKEWWNSPGRVTGGGGTGRSDLLRPRLLLDQWQGLLLHLPSEPCDTDSSQLEWHIQVDGANAIVRIVPRFPGDSRTQADEAAFVEPFAALVVRLKTEYGQERGAWVFEGLPMQSPVLFFRPDTSAVLRRESIGAGPTGIAFPAGARAIVRQAGAWGEAATLAEIGRLPFGWSGLDAAVIDLTDADRVRVVSASGSNLAEVELRDTETPTPRLVAADAPVAAAGDGSLIFSGAAPTLQIAVSPEQFVQTWRLRIRPSRAHHAGLPDIEPPAGDVFAEPVADGRWLAIPLGQPQLLGDVPWGAFDLVATGPMGQDARFQFTILPKVAVSHDWAEWKDGDKVRVRLRCSPRTQIIGAGEPVQPGVYEVSSSGQRLQLKVLAPGYGGRAWSLPFEVSVPVPSWAIYDESSSQHLLAWSRLPLRFGLPDTDGRSAFLLLRATTPWGVPTVAALLVESAAGTLLRMPVDVDSRGYGRADLAPMLARVRQLNVPKVVARLELTLPSTSSSTGRAVRLDCLSVERHWTADDLSIDEADGEAVVSWKERFPIQGRALRVVSLLTPWQPPAQLPIDGGSAGCWRGPTHALAPAPGRFRVELGIADEWTGSFEVCSMTVWDLGTPDDWRRSALASAQSVDGFLHRLLICHAQDSPFEEAVPDLSDAARHLCLNVVRARLALGTASSGGLAGRLDRLLARAPVHDVLRAIAAVGQELSPSGVIETRLFLRAPITAGGELTDEESDALWRLWPPLGAWAEMLAIVGHDAGAERRMVRRLGAGPLSSLSPLGIGSKIKFKTAGEEDQERPARVSAIVADSSADPFDLRCLRPPVSLNLEGLAGTALAGKPFRATCVGRRRWEFTPLGDAAAIPPQFDLDSVEVFASVHYPRELSSCRGAPEGAVVGLVRAKRAAALQAMKEHCLPFPVSLIGPEAWQDAGFDWAIRAAADPVAADKLTEVCRENRLKGRELFGDSATVPDRRSAEYRVVAELKERWSRFGSDDPLFAVHYVTWITAVTLVWRGLLRHLPFPWPEVKLVETAIALHELAPKLLAHDLVKVCAIEALVAAGLDDAPGPRPADD